MAVAAAEWHRQHTEAAVAYTEAVRCASQHLGGKHTITKAVGVAESNEFGGSALAPAPVAASAPPSAQNAGNDSSMSSQKQPSMNMSIASVAPGAVRGILYVLE